MTCDAAAADRIDAEFQKALPGAESVLRGVGNAATGSPTWSKGNLALADLQNIRGRLAQVLAPAEQAYVTDTEPCADRCPRRRGEPPRGERVWPVAMPISMLASAEDEQIDRLHTMLPD
jgi:hypothetical protein